MSLNVYLGTAHFSCTKVLCKLLYTNFQFQQCRLFKLKERKPVNNEKGREDKDIVLTTLREEVGTVPVGDFEGIKITCGQSECVFEFVVYEFIGEYPEPPPHPCETQQGLAELEHPSVGQNVRRQPPPSAVPVPPHPHVPPLPCVVPAPVGTLPPPLGTLPPPLGTLPPHSGEPSNAGSIALILPANMFPEFDVSDIENFFAGNAAIQLSARNQESPIRLVVKDGRETNSPAINTPGRPLLRHVSVPVPGHGPIIQNDSNFRNNRKQERLNESRRENEQQKFSNTEATQQTLEAAAEIVDVQPAVSYHAFNGSTSTHNGIHPHTPPHAHTPPTSWDNPYSRQDSDSIV